MPLKNKNTIIVFLFAFMALSVTGASAVNIGTCTQLQAMQNNLSGTYVLTGDIDCTGFDSGDGKGFLPVGSSSTPFSGSFDGQSHTITGLSINRSSQDYVGLFGFTYANTSNVGLKNVNVTGHNYVGALAGEQGGGTISKSYSTGSLSFTGYAGGLVGYADGVISNCYSTVNLSGGDYNIGGLVGRLWQDGKITNSYASGNVSASGSDYGYAGGLVGGSFSTIATSFATGNVAGCCGHPGGLVSYTPANSITNCYFNHTAGNPANCIGYSGSGTCTAINNNQGYFYATGSPPMDQWNFTSNWSNSKNNTGFPILLWETGGPACSFPAGGNATLSGSCGITGVDGVDNGNLTLGSGCTLTVLSGGTLAWNQGKQINLSGGQVVVRPGGQLKKTNIWYIDNDNDGCASSTEVAQDTQPTHGIRRYAYAQSGWDTNDNDPAQGSITAYVDADHDGYGAGAPVNICGSSLPSGYSSNNTDCDDYNNTKWQSLPGYVDADGDGYGAGTQVSVCSGASLPSGYVSNNLDCNDNPASGGASCYPGNTAFTYSPDGLDNDCQNGIDDQVTADYQRVNSATNMSSEDWCALQVAHSHCVDIGVSNLTYPVNDFYYCTHLEPNDGSHTYICGTYWYTGCANYWSLVGGDCSTVMIPTVTCSGHTPANIAGYQAYWTNATCRVSQYH